MIKYTINVVSLDMVVQSTRRVTSTRKRKKIGHSTLKCKGCDGYIMWWNCGGGGGLCYSKSCEMQGGCFLVFEVSKILRTVRPLRLTNQ